tara:strand:- start:91 stop:333 length:243 start_codon:yes stop_codon:yes gene_type:complete
MAIKTYTNDCIFKHLKLFTTSHTREELEVLNDEKLRKKLNQEQLEALTSLIRKFNKFNNKLDKCILLNTAVKEDINLDIF